jgi:hypothetical protein
MGRDGRTQQWMRFRERVRETWGVLTEEDLAGAGGDWKVLARIVEERTGARRRDIEHHLRFLLEDDLVMLDEPAEGRGVRRGAAGHAQR